MNAIQALELFPFIESESISMKPDSALSTLLLICFACPEPLIFITPDAYMFDTEQDLFLLLAPLPIIPFIAPHTFFLLNCSNQSLYSPNLSFLFAQWYRLRSAIRFIYCRSSLFYFSAVLLQLKSEKNLPNSINCDQQHFLFVAHRTFSVFQTQYSRFKSNFFPYPLSTVLINMHFLHLASRPCNYWCFVQLAEKYERLEQC